MLTVVIGIHRLLGARKKAPSPLQEIVRGLGIVLRGVKGVWFIHSVIEHLCDDTVRQWKIAMKMNDRQSRR